MTANSNYIQKEKKSVMNDDNLIMQNLSDDELIIFNQWVFNVATPIVCSLSEKNKDKVQYNIDMSEQQMQEIYKWILCGYDKVAMILGKEAFSDLCQKMPTALDL